MPKFGWCKFAEDKFSVLTRYHNLKFRMAGTTLLGVEIRRTIGKGPKCTPGAVTYRVRPGNGSFGSIVGKVYQDKYNYSAAMKAIDNAPTPYQRNYATAIDYWQNVLTDDEKKEYNGRAGKKLRMSGYNLFLREALTGVYHMYVDRGDPSAFDFIETDLTIDGAWHDLDLSAIVPKTARAILLALGTKTGGVGSLLRFRKNGNVYVRTSAGLRSQVANVAQYGGLVVAYDTNQVIEYNAEAVVWAYIQITVRGWWT